MCGTPGAVHPQSRFQCLPEGSQLCCGWGDAGAAPGPAGCSQDTVSLPAVGLCRLLWAPPGIPPPLQAGKPRTENLRTHTCNPPGALAGRKQLRLAAGGASPVPCRKPLGRQADLGRGCVPLPLSRKKDLLSRGGSRLSPRSQSPSSEPGSWACAQRSCLAQAAVRLAAAGGAEGG